MNTDPSPRLLLLTPLFNGRDGISLVSRLAAGALATQGFAVDVLSLCNEPHRSVPDGVRLWSAEGNAGMFSARAASGALRAVPAHTRVLTMHVHLAITALPLVWRGATLSIFLHGIETWKPLRARERIAMRAASTVLANSSETTRRFREINTAFHDLSITTCPLGVAPLEAPVAGPRIGPDRFALIVGRLDEEFRYKGHDELLELWPGVLDQFPNFGLVVAGDGTDRRRLQKKAEALRLQDAVQFTGRVDDEKLKRLYRDCEFFAMPSTGEGFGLVYLEAMRARKACLAAPGAAAAIIEDGNSGIIADPKHKDQLLGALLTLIGQPQRTVEMGNAGYQRFLNHFTANHFGSTLVAALKSKGTQCAE